VAEEAKIVALAKRGASRNRNADPKPPVQRCPRRVMNCPDAIVPQSLLFARKQSREEIARDEFHFAQT
jgi:hypothetical protein